MPQPTDEIRLTLSREIPQAFDSVAGIHLAHRAAPEFRDFLQAVHATKPDQPHPTPVEQFIGSHPETLAFIQTPKPIPTSFARESYFSVTAYKFIDAQGAARHLRYRLLPPAGN